MLEDIYPLRAKEATAPIQDMASLRRELRFMEDGETMHLHDFMAGATFEITRLTEEKDELPRIEVCCRCCRCCDVLTETNIEESERNV